MIIKSNPFTSWPPSHEDLYWVVGILDGEGTFYREKARGTPRIECTMQDKDTIVRLATVLGCGCGESSLSVIGTRMYRAVATTTRAKVIMETIRPLMSIRRQEQIDHALELTV